MVGFLGCEVVRGGREVLLLLREGLERSYGKRLVHHPQSPVIDPNCSAQKHIGYQSLINSLSVIKMVTVLGSSNVLILAVLALILEDPLLARQAGW